MQIFLITFGVFLAVVVAMAIGYIFQKKSISGSCGGLGTIGIEKECDCPEPCDNRKKKMAKLKKKLAAAKSGGDREAVLKKIRLLSPEWREPEPVQ